MNTVNLVEVRVQKVSPGDSFPEQIGEFEFLAVPRVGELVHVIDTDGETRSLKVIMIDHHAEAKEPFVSGAFILLTCQTED